MEVLKIKKTILFLFGLSFFFLPGQNWYLAVQANYRPSPTQPLAMVVPLPSDYPVNFTGQKPPWLSARAVAVIDADSAVPLYLKNEKIALLPASTVKLMTALVALDYYSLDQVLTVKEIDTQPQKMDLEEGELIKVRDLLAGLLISSANDAALVLAQNYPGGEKEFVKAMNKKAGELHLKNTFFVNPTGLDSDKEGKLFEQLSYTTALDLARLAKFALKNETIKNMVATKKMVVSSVDQKVLHPLFNLNQLLWQLPEVKGVKTGWTEEAGECLITLVEKRGRRLLIVVLGSSDRFGETARLIKWVFTNYRWERMIPLLTHSIGDQ